MILVKGALKYEEEGWVFQSFHLSIALEPTIMGYMYSSTSWRQNNYDGYNNTLWIDVV